MMKMKTSTKIAYLLAFTGLMGIVGYFEQEPKTEYSYKPFDIVVERQEPVTEKEAKIAKFLATHGSTHDKELAKAIVKHKRPRLLTAVAVVESNGNPAAIGKSGEKGAFQVMEKHWGEVSDEIQSQTDQAALILESLLAANNGNIKKALTAYNGDQSGRYAEKVIKKVRQL